MNDLPYQHCGYPEVFTGPPGEKGSGVFVAYLNSHEPDTKWTVYEMAPEEARQFAEGMRLTYLFLYGDDE